MRCAHQSSREELKENFELLARVCNTCGAWLALGPAQDDGEHAEQVAIERRAAALGGADADACTWVEWSGYNCHEISVRTGVVLNLVNHPQWQAGYLAHCIAAHGGDP